MKKFLFVPPKGEKGGLEICITKITIGTFADPANLGTVIFPPIEINREAWIQLAPINENGSAVIPSVNIPPKSLQPKSDDEGIPGRLTHLNVRKTEGKNPYVVFESYGILFQTNLLARDYLKEAPIDPPPFPV